LKDWLNSEARGATRPHSSEASGSAGVQCAPLEVLFNYIDLHLSDFIEDLIQICEVPAPTFLEEKRGRFFASFFGEMAKPEFDGAGNVIIPISRNGSPHVVLSAHLDTVFPFHEIVVKRSGTLLQAPGISDDSAGLACLLFLWRALRHAQYLTKGSLTLLATVGEEGLGNLRGARHFFEKYSEPIDYFISLDGCDAERIVSVGLASKRLRILLRGPGGHSWGDAGLPNPIHLSGEFLARLNRVLLPQNPKTTINVGIISGGTSVNTIPSEMYMDVDLRSESMESLKWLDDWVQRTLQESVANHPVIETEVITVGERPAGSIPLDHPLLQTAIAANRRFSLDAKLETGSTDSNIPFSLGIPAITTGVGGSSGKIHTPEEWYDVRGAETGIKRTAFLITQLLSS
jgi:tripeptide aminopeptidase